MYWDALHRLVHNHQIIIDRPKGTKHPRYTHIIYPVDYGYLEGTTTVDNGGIDIFVGSLQDDSIKGVVCTVDELKNDAEIKIMYNCSDEEIHRVVEFLNNNYMSAIFLPKVDKY